MYIVMEDVVGEYVLNISKENLKIAALRGKVKLENVQLDGDLIGSHVLGAVGLSGFAVLSCWAKTIKIVVPLRNLERDATRIELHGIYLLCVPLLPSTAHREYGTGSKVDPRCTLRTRGKRSALARLERNFFGGRIAGDGPPSRRARIAMREAERGLRKHQAKNNRQKSNKGSFKGSLSSPRRQNKHKHDFDEDGLLESEYDSSEFFVDFDNINGDSSDRIGGSGRGGGDNDEEEKSTKAMNAAESIVNPGPTWKSRMRETMMRNMEIGLFGLHIRCEVSEGGLDFCPPEVLGRIGKKLPAYQRSFAFGWTVESFVVTSDESENDTVPEERGNNSQNDTNTTTNNNNKDGTDNGNDATIGTTSADPNTTNTNGTKKGPQHEKFLPKLSSLTPAPVMMSPSERAKRQVGASPRSLSSPSSLSSQPSSSPATSSSPEWAFHKIGTMTNMSIYWDDDPPFLISECRLLCAKARTIPIARVHSYIMNAMEALVTHQYPGELIGFLLDETAPRYGQFHSTASLKVFFPLGAICFVLCWFALHQTSSHPKPSHLTSLHLIPSNLTQFATPKTDVEPPERIPSVLFKIV